MAPSDRPPTGATPRIIPLRPHRQPVPADHALRDAIARAAADAVRSIHGLPPVTISVDVAADHAADAATPAVAARLRRLLDAACAAVAASGPRGEGPTLREVVVTSVDTGDALEIEVADSAADVSHQQAAIAELRPQVERDGWTLAAAACPEGGLAVTLRIPRRRGRSLAA